MQIAIIKFSEKDIVIHESNAAHCFTDRYILHTIISFCALNIFNALSHEQKIRYENASHIIEIKTC